MTTNEILFLISTLELMGIAAIVNVFVFLYLFRSNWSATLPGKALMSSKVSLAILVDLSLVTAFLGQDWPGRQVVRTVLFGAILISQGWLLLVLIKVQRETPDNKKGEIDETSLG